MLSLISPAKTLDFKRPLPPHTPSKARFADEAMFLAEAAAKLTRPKLERLMHISPKLAALNVERFRAFAEQPTRPAIHAFAGDVYAGLEARSLEPEAIRFAQDHLRILSGLYGLLRPLDAIRPYRLEMGTNWAPGRKKDLYAFWGDRIGRAVGEDMAMAGTAVVLNLASKEYMQAARPHLDGIRIIDIDFREDRPDGPRFVSFSAKRARGMMARYVCEHAIDDPEALKNFDSDGYVFDPEHSSDDSWRFLRRT